MSAEVRIMATSYIYTRGGRGHGTRCKSKTAPALACNYAGLLILGSRGHTTCAMRACVDKGRIDPPGVCGYRLRPGRSSDRGENVTMPRTSPSFMALGCTKMPEWIGSMLAADAE